MHLSDVCELIIDCPHSSVPDEGEGFPMIRTSDIGKGRLCMDRVHRVSRCVYEERNKRAVPRDNDLILAREAPIGNVAIIKNGALVCLGQRTVLIRPDAKKVDPDYLLYYLLSPKIQHIFSGSSNGTVISHLNLSKIKCLNVDIPDMQVQKNIGAYFSVIDDKIQVNNDLSKKIEEYIALLYEQWFIDFNFPDENGKPFRSSGGKMITDKTTAVSVPCGWKVVPLLDVVDWIGNSQPPKKDFVFEPREGYVRFIQNRDYDSDAHVTYIPQTKKLHSADEFDILMDKYGDAGKVRYGIDGAFSVALGMIRVKESEMQEYVRSFFLSKKIYSYLHNTCMASTRSSLSKNNLEALMISLPNRDITARYQSMVREMREYLLTLKNENKKLSDYKERMISRVFTDQSRYRQIISNRCGEEL